MSIAVCFKFTFTCFTQYQTSLTSRVRKMAATKHAFLRRFSCDCNLVSLMVPTDFPHMLRTPLDNRDIFSQEIKVLVDSFASLTHASRHSRTFHRPCRSSSVDLRNFIFLSVVRVRNETEKVTLLGYFSSSLKAFYLHVRPYSNRKMKTLYN